MHDRCKHNLDVHEPAKRKKLDRFPIKVSGLTKAISKSWIQNTFKHYGEVQSIEPGKIDSAAYVYFSSQEAAISAAKDMNEESVGGKKLNVEVVHSASVPKLTQEDGITCSRTVTSTQALQHRTCDTTTSYRTNVITGIIYSTTDSTSTVSQEIKSLKLTNISPTTSEATLVERCKHLEGFCSLKLVKVGSDSTSYAWANFTNLHAVAAQAGLHGMVLNGYTLKASQPHPYKYQLAQHTQQEVPSVLQPLPQFSFKHPSASTSMPPTPCAFTNPSTTPSNIHHNISCRSPSGSNKPLFNPIPCGLPIASVDNSSEGTTLITSRVDTFKMQETESSDSRPKKQDKYIPPKAATLLIEQLPPVDIKKTKSLVHNTYDSDEPKVEVTRKASLPAIKLSLARPPTSIPKIAHNTPTNVKDGERRQSVHNPFKHALVRHSSKSIQSDSISCIKKEPLPEVTVKVDFSDILVKKIVISANESELNEISRIWNITISGRNIDNSSLVLSSTDPISLNAAKKKVFSLRHEVIISKREFSVDCSLLPCLADSAIIAQLQKMEEKEAIELVIVTSSSHLRMSTCMEQLQSLFSSTGTPLHLSVVKEFTEIRLGSYWKVIHSQSKQVEPFDSNINEKINAAYTNHETTCSFQYRSHSYKIEFPQMVLRDETNGETHNIIKAEPLWRYLKDEDFGFQPLPETTSCEIEQVFQNGAPWFLTIEGEECVLDFESDQMQIESIEKKIRVPIQRDPPVHSKEHVFRVRVRGMKDKLLSIEEQFQHTLKRSIISETLQIPVEINTCSSVSRCLFQSLARQYCIQYVFSQEEQSFCFKGTKENVSGIKSIVLSAILKLFRLQKKVTPHFPSEWESQTENIALCQVTTGSSEWNHIVQLMKNTMPNVEIKVIERIQNKSLWEKYIFFKKRMEDKTGKKGVNEKELFHGTRKNHPSMIFKSEKGFDFRFGNEESLWGTGTYFAVNASYSDSKYAYIASNGQKMLLLARVVTGDSKRISNPEKLKLPPLKPGKMIERYDTIIATTGGSDIYVVYDHEKAYPAYVISYSN